MRKSLKYTGFTVLGLIALYFFVINSSGTESSFQCAGDLSSNGTSRSTTVYMKLDEYRPWVGLWSDSDVSINLEIPSQWVAYYGQVEKVGDQFQIYEEGGLRGNFFTLSKTLLIDFGSPFGFFDGICSITN